MTRQFQGSNRAPTFAGRKTMSDLVLATVALPGDAIEQAATAAGTINLLKPANVAERLAVSERTLERWRMTGEGPEYLSLSRKTVRYTADSVARFVAARLRTNTAQN